MPVIACGDRQSMPAGGRRDVAVFDGHALAGLVEQPLLLGPNVRNRYIEAVNSPPQVPPQAALAKPVGPGAAPHPWYAPSKPVAR